MASKLKKRRRLNLRTTSAYHHDLPPSQRPQHPTPAMITPPTALRAFRAPITVSRLAPQQVRHATLLRRPKRPYTFTQLITLSDGSSFTLRTTSPEPVYKSAKDIRNNPLWNPSSQKLLNVEEDEAGRLAAFRAKYGRSWDSDGDAAQTKDSKGKVCFLRFLRGLRRPEARDHG